MKERDEQGERVTRVVRESVYESPGGDNARCRGFPYFPSDGGIDGAINGTNPGECDHGPQGSCWLCREL